MSRLVIELDGGSVSFPYPGKVPVNARAEDILSETGITVEPIEALQGMYFESEPRSIPIDLS